MKRIIQATLLAGVATGAHAQSSPNWGYGKVPTAGEWNTEFASKQDYLGYPPLNAQGGSMIGKLYTALSAPAKAGLNIGVGSAPGAPIGGDVWMTPAGMYYDVNGGVVGPIGVGGGGSGSSLFGVQVDPLSVTSTNHVSSLTKSADGQIIQIVVNGVIYSNIGGAPAFSLSGSTVVWNAGNAGHSIVSGDTVLAVYTTSTLPPAATLGSGVSLALQGALGAPNGVAAYDNSGNAAVPGTTVTINSNLLMQDTGGYAFLRETSSSGRLYLGYGATNAVEISNGGVQSGINVSAPQFIGGGASLTGLTKSLQILDPTDYGATCSGGDETAHIQAWLNAFTFGAYVRLPPKTCNFSSPLTLPQVDGIVWQEGGTLNYTGGQTSTPIVSGGYYATYGCAMTRWHIHGLRLTSSTAMTAGEALHLQDACEFDLDHIVIGGNLGGNFNWYTAVHFDGGNSVHMSHYDLDGTGRVEIVNGDPTYQFSDMFQTDGKIIGNQASGGVGITIGGKVGGFEIMQSDVLANATEMRIDQSQISAPNYQVFLGSNTVLDVTGSAGAGVGLDVADAGDLSTNNSILNVDGAWISSSNRKCLWFESGVEWRVKITGTTFFNCTTNSIQNDSVNVSGIVASSYMDFAGSTEIVATVNDPYLKFQDIGFGINPGTLTSGTVYLQDYTYSATGGKVFSNPIGIGTTPSHGSLDVNGSIYTSASYLSSLSSTAGWQLDVSGQAAASVASGTSVALAVGSGLIVVNDQTNGDVSTYLCGGANCAFLGSTNGYGVAATITPASGHYSVEFNGTNYALYSNIGASHTFTFGMLRTRAGT